MVPAEGLEPSHPKIVDFESTASTIPPGWHIFLNKLIILYNYIKCKELN